MINDHVSSSYIMGNFYRYIMGNFAQITSLTHCIVLFTWFTKLGGLRLSQPEWSSLILQLDFVTNQMFYQLTSLVQRFSGQ